MIRRAAILTAALGACAAIIPAGAASAAPATSPSTGNPTLDKTLAEANKLSQQIEALGQQYDNLKIQLSQAQAEAASARKAATRERALFASDQGSIAALAVEGYVSGGSLSPTVQLLTAGSPQSVLDKASIMAQLQRENGAQTRLVASAEVLAQRSEAAANQEEARATLLTKQMQANKASMAAKEKFFNGQAFAQAAAIYQKTGSYPNITVSGDSVGVQALRYALSKVGDPYVYAAAGPNTFDCSGLTMWAYAQVGISLEHYTGDQWNEGVHVSRAQLQPGDLVFFYSNLDHVGMYVGNGLMVDAPYTGVDVRVEPVFWDQYQGAVRIA